MLCLAASGCFGGPTSDWPPRNNDNGGEGPKSPPSTGAGAADAGIHPGLSIDAGTAAGGSKPCDPSFGADGGASDAGVGDPDDPSNPFDDDPDEPESPDAGCR